MNLTTIQINTEGPLMFLTLNRSAELNAINKQMLVEINYVLGMCEYDDSIRAILITGSGEKAFAAGADIKEFINYNKEEGTILSLDGKALVFDKIATFKKPVIALINGYALGGGLELAMACHLRIAAVEAKMGLPELSLGIIPGYGGTFRLPQLIGQTKAFEMILTGEMINASTALSYGLVNKVCDQESLLEQGIVMARAIIKNAPNAIKKAIKAINSVYNNTTEDDVESKLFGECFQHKDFIEGTLAFLEKRKPNFE